MAAPALAHLEVPFAVVILFGLFVIQRYGTGAVGWLFGPILLIWFTALGLLGAHEVIQHPSVFQALSPTWGARFMVDHGVAAFLTLGGVVLAVTGAEALYADRGHFGAGPIRFTWLLIAFPALILNYLGQGALILAHPSAVSNPFLLLVPGWGRLAMVILSTVATVIASQAAITGSFSVARQAVQLGFLPRLQIVHTSKLEGQIYVPAVNWGLCVGVIALVLAFQSSNRLAEMYGVAVTGTFILNTLLFLAVSRYLWRTAVWKLVILGALFLTVETAFFSANLAKIEHGAWLPLVVALVVSVGMITWRKGREIVTANRIAKEGPLEQFLDGLPDAAPSIRRVPGTAIFLNPGQETTPLALRAEIEHAHAMQERVVIVSVETVSVPHIDGDDRFYCEHLGRGLFKVIHLTVRCGYRDGQDIPKALALARKQGLLERSLDLEHASYFLSRISITPTDAPGMSRWRKRLFVTLARNAASPIEHFSLPDERTVTIGSQIAI